MKILFIFLILISALFLTSTAFAQMSNIELDSRNHYGEISIESVKVIKKEHYNVIVLDTHFKVKDLELENIVSIYPDSIKLVNENGKTYFPTREECNIPEPLVKVPDGGPCYEVKNECAKPVWNFNIKGTEGGIGQYHPCFRVEKELKNFKVYYGFKQFGKSLPDSYQIGTIDVNQINSKTVTENSDIMEDIPNKTRDFFSELIELFRSWFHFS